MDHQMYCPPTPIASDLAIALDHEVTARQAAETNVAELLERIALVTGVDLSTEPTAEAVAAGLAVLDSLASPVDESPGWYWSDPWGSEGPGRTGTFDTVDEAHDDAQGEEMPAGYFVMCVRDGQALAPMYCPPTRKGGN
jgi:hypothetical protein